MYVAERHHGSQSLFWLVSCQVEEESHLNTKLGYQRLKNTRLCVLILVRSLTQQIWEEGGPLLLKKRAGHLLYRSMMLKKKCSSILYLKFHMCLNYLNTETAATVKPTSASWKTANTLSALYFTILLPKFWFWYTKRTSHSSVTVLQNNSALSAVAIR